MARELEVGARGQNEVVLTGVLGLESGGEVGARDREADAHVAAVLVPETGVDADVDRLARVGVRPDPAADVDLLVAVHGDRVDRADHAPLGLFDVGRDRRLPERLRNHALEELISGLHPAPPLGDDRELEAAGVLVELADQRVHPARVEGRPLEAVERGEDADIGRVAPEGAAARLRELLDVVAADVPRARFEGHDVAELRGRYLLGHHSHQLPPAIGDRRDDAVGERDPCGHQRRFDAVVKSLEQGTEGGADHEPEERLARAQAEQTRGEPR